MSRRAPGRSPIPYLFLDATFLDARWARTVENVSALVAYGIGLDGKRQLLARHDRRRGSPRAPGAICGPSSTSAASRASSSSAVALQVTAIWTDRRYLDMSLLKPKEAAVAKAA